MQVCVEFPTESTRETDSSIHNNHYNSLKQLFSNSINPSSRILHTHGEMLPAHAYPELKKYAHLKGNYGTTWQNQQKEFADIPAPILFTTNCLMPPKESYADRVFTTEMVASPEIVHIGENKDFTSFIEKALELGGCDGAKTGRNYYTEFVKQTPADTSASWHKKYSHRSVTACVHFSECTELPCEEL